MDQARALLIVMWVGVTLYALLAGADFGGGILDLLAGRSQEGHAAAPPHRALHRPGVGGQPRLADLCHRRAVDGLPPVFAAVMSTLYIPLTLVALGIIARGAAFAFRKASTELWQQRLFGAAFAVSSVLTPFFLGTVAGAVASGRVPPGLAAGDLVNSWLAPTSLLGGVLAVGVCAYLAAVYLCDDAVRAGLPELAGDSAAEP